MGSSSPAEPRSWGFSDALRTGYSLDRPCDASGTMLPCGGISTAALSFFSCCPMDRLLPPQRVRPGREEGEPAPGCWQGVAKLTRSTGQYDERVSLGLISPRASSPSVRAVMQGNRGRDSAPEVGLRSALHRRGFRFRVNLKLGQGRSAPRPDIVFTRHKVCVFVDGCFWHSCPQHGTQPRTNVSYWEEKLERNRKRDARDTARLEADGWTVVRVWEHDCPEAAAHQLEQALTARAAKVVACH